MRSNSRAAGFLQVMRQLLPNAELSLIHERPWHSLTFSGSQLCVSAVLADRCHADTATRIAKLLPEYDFDLKRQLVADIAVIEMASTATQSRLTIDALLLDA
jgi:hypothetical protein